MSEATSANSSDDGWLVAGSTSPDEVRRYYDDLANQYDSTLAAWGYDAPERVAALVLANEVSRVGLVLDAGCGTGLVGVALRSAGFTGAITGIDLSSASLAEATGRGVYAELLAADLQERLPFPDASFDAVVCVGVLTYVPDVRGVWGEFCRVTQPGGVIVCTQRDDLWNQRGCAAIADEFERAGAWKVVTLTASTHYLPDNQDFGDTIGVRYLATRRR